MFRLCILLYFIVLGRKTYVKSSIEMFNLIYEMKNFNAILTEN